MSRCKCDWQHPCASEDMYKRIAPPTLAEQVQMESFFQQHLVVTVRNRNEKQIMCTGCKQNKEVRKSDDYYKIKHGEQRMCPFCGRLAEVIYAGRMGHNCKKMYERQQFVVCHAEPAGWLSAQAFAVVKNYSGKNWETEIDMHRVQISMFRPGCALQWKKDAVYDPETDSVVRKWIQRKTIGEPFSGGMFDWINGVDSRRYTVIGSYNHIETLMKYSEVDFFEELQEQDFGVIRYLGEYCHRPQLEMLLKLGLYDIVRELIYWQHANAHLVNWRAKDIKSFLRLDKPYVKLYMQEKKPTVRSLEVMQMIQHNHCHNWEVIRYLQRLSLNTLKDCADIAQDKGIERIVKYLIKQGERDPVQWIDYIRMARKLKYDLTVDTVFFPKNLKERHDAAAQTIEIKASEEEDKKIQRGYKELCQMYQFTDGEFSIIVPKSIDAIVEEGKALHHCVGNYAARHTDGYTTILFLRKTEEIDKPYGTIEMSAERPDDLIQLRGDHNNAVPKTESAAFIARWQAWIASGSVRDKRGNPIAIGESRTA